MKNLVTNMARWGSVSRWAAWLCVLLSLTSREVAAAGPGSLDPSFRPDFSLGPNESVRALARDSEGRWLVAKGNTVMRLFSDGRLDPGFAAGASGDGEVRALAMASDGRVYVGGSFTNFAGWRSPGLVRLRADGTRDESFPAMNPQYLSTQPGYVAGLTMQSDQRLLVSGTFALWNGQRAPSITRLGIDGGMDRDFTENLRPVFGGATHITVTFTNINGTFVAVTNITVSYETLSRSGTILSTALRPDGRVLMGGVVFAELETDGRPVGVLESGMGSAWAALPGGEVLMVDTGLPEGSIREVRVRRLRSGAEWPVLWETTVLCDGSVTAVQPLPDGRTLLGGTFTQVRGQRHEGVVRLNADGTVDAGFVAQVRINDGRSWERPLPSEQAVRIWGFHREPDGAVLVYGRFNQVDGQGAPGLARLQGGDRGSAPPEWASGATLISAIEGYPTRAGFAVSSATPLRAGWYRDGKPIPGATSPVLDFGRIRLGQSGLYQLRVTNDAGTAESPVVRVNVELGPTHPGSMDGTFHAAPVKLSDGPVNTRTWVTGMVPAGSGFDVFGQFEAYDGHATRWVARVQSDGRVDPGFVMLRGDPRVGTVVSVKQWEPLSDGRCVAEVEFPFSVWTVTSAKHELIAVRADGSVDPDFVPGVRPSAASFGYGPLACTSDGGLLVSGSLGTAPLSERLRLARLRADGSVDPGFRGQIHPTKSVRGLTVQGDGRVLVVWVDNDSSTSVAVQRLLPDGSDDGGFRLDTTDWIGARELTLDTQGRILIIPNWKPGRVGPSPALLRFLPNGSPDPSFTLALGSPWPSTLQVYAMGMQSDGRLLLRVSSSQPVSTSFPSLVRVESDGALDPGFQLAAPEWLSPFGGILVGLDDRITLATDVLGSLVRLNAHDERRLEASTWDGQSFETTLHTRPGRRYILESSAAVMGENWAEVGVVDGDGGMKRFRDTAGERRFYRMRLEDR